MTDDTISRQAALISLKNALVAWSNMSAWREAKIMKAIAEVPTAERKGHWTIGKDSIGHKRLICTLCGNGIAYMRKFDYCPNCGARMERKDD